MFFVWEIRRQAAWTFPDPIRHPSSAPPLHNLIIHQANAVQLVPTGDPILMDIVWPTWERRYRVPLVALKNGCR
jgi:hypothetical protein